MWRNQLLSVGDNHFFTKVQVGLFFSLNILNPSLKTAFSIYSGYLCVIFNLKCNIGKNTAPYKLSAVDSHSPLKLA